MSEEQNRLWVALGLSPLPRVTQSDLSPWRPPLVHQPEPLGAPGIAFTRLDHADAVELFRMTLPPPADLGSPAALWFRSGDMIIDGANDPVASARIETPLPIAN